MLRTLVLAVTLSAIATEASATTLPKVDELGTTDIVEIIGTRVVDLDGNGIRLGLKDGLSPVVVIFLETTCVISKRYAPELSDFARTAEENGLELYAVVSEPNVDAPELRIWREDLSLNVPLLFDASGDLAMRLRPTVVPEAIVIGKEDTVLYRGRIDNRFAAVGRLRNNITSHDLRDAMVAIGRGDAPAHSRTEHVGCAFEAWTDELPETVTYTRDIAPILRTHCTECHRPNNVAPFSLLTYQDARRRAKMIAKVTADSFMPPWWVRPGHGQFWGARHLSDRQLGLLEAWARQGTPEGNPEDLLPTPPEPPRRGLRNRVEPTLTVTIPELSLPATGPDVYRYFVFPTPPEMAKDKVLLGVHIEAGDPEVVHHVDYFVDYSGRARKLDEADPEPGFSVFGTGSFLSYFDAGFLGAWAPGEGRPYEPRSGDRERLGQYVEGGGDLVMEIHYHLSGKKTKDATSMSLYLDDPESVDRYIGTLFAGTTDVDIPAGEDDYQRHFWMDVPADVDIFSIAAHMHYLGQDVSAVVTLPDGTEKSIFRLDRWDFRWQGSYSYLEPLRIPAGSRIDLWYRFDNSSNNYANPFDPPVRATWGWGTDQEMCEVYLTAAPAKNEDLDRLRRAAYASWFRSADPAAEMPMDIADSKKAFRELDEIDLFAASAGWMLRTLASLPEDFDRLIEEFARAAEASPTADAFAKHGLMLLTSSGLSISNEGRFELLRQADRAFDRALELDANHWGARASKARAYARAPEDLGLWDDAVDQYEILVGVQEASGEKLPRYASTYAALGDLHALLGDRNRAAEVWQAGAELFPGNRELERRLRTPREGAKYNGD